MLATVIGLCILSAVATLFVKKTAPEFALLISAITGAVVLIFLIISASSIFYEIESLFLNSGLDGSIFKIVLKALGICYIVSFGTELCRDFNQTSLASKIDLAGKIAIVVITMPLIKEILNAAIELVK